MRNSQRGIFLIGAGIAIAIVGILVTYGMNQYAYSLRTQKAEAVGEALKVVGDGMQSFIVEHHAEISDALSGDTAQSLKGIDATLGPVMVKRVSRLDPTMEISMRGGAFHPPTALDVIQLAKLPGVGDRPPMLPGAAYVVRIFDGAPLTPGKNVRGLVYIDKPITRTYGGIDGHFLITAIRKIGVHAGFSRADDAGQITFPLTPPGTSGPQHNTLANPTNKAGILAMRVGHPLGPLNTYLRRDGSQPMTGDLDMDDHKLQNVSEIAPRSGALKIGGDVRTRGLQADRVIVGPHGASPAGVFAPTGKDGWVIAMKGIASGNVTAGVDPDMATDLANHSGVVAASGGVWSYGNLWARKDIYNKDGNLLIQGGSDKGNIKATGEISGKRLLIRGTQTALDADTLTLGEAIDPNAQCATVGQIGRDGGGQFHVCRGNRWETLKGERGATGPTGADGARGFPGGQGPSGPPGADADVRGYVTVYEYANCTQRILQTPTTHNFCWLSRYDPSNCTSGNWGKARVDVVNATLSKEDDGGWSWSEVNSYNVGKQHFFQLQSFDLHSAMTCVDFR